jgi:glycosyltransferase involved in cell wall biosynthesis
MAYGLPCIAANRCAMPEIVQHEETGLIVQAEDPVSLADAMIAFARSPQDAAKLGANGRKRVEAEFTWSAVAAKVKATLSNTYGVL